MMLKARLELESKGRVREQEKGRTKQRRYRVIARAYLNSLSKQTSDPRLQCPMRFNTREVGREHSLCSVTSCKADTHESKTVGIKHQIQRAH